MAEEKKTRGATTRAGNAPKTRRKKKNGWGGRREGAGRKKGTGSAYKGEVLTAQEVFCVRASTHEWVKQLRALTKHDAMPFNRMFEKWVEDMAEAYGLTAGQSDSSDNQIAEDDSLS